MDRHNGVCGYRGAVSRGSSGAWRGLGSPALSGPAALRVLASIRNRTSPARTPFSPRWGAFSGFPTSSPVYQKRVDDGVWNSGRMSVGNVAVLAASPRDGGQGESPSIVGGLGRFMYRRWTQDAGAELVASLLAANAAVFLGWRLAPRLGVEAQHWMYRHFTHSVEGVRHGGRFHTLVTSNFSHKGFLHFGVNMFGLYHFGQRVVDTRVYRSHPIVEAQARAPRLSATEFYGMYMAAGLVGSGASHVFRIAQGALVVPSLGASGAVFGVLTYFLVAHPEAQMLVMGIPMQAETLMAVNVLMNAAGALYSLTSGKAAIDTAAHLGGIAVGLLMYQYKKYSANDSRRPPPPPVPRQHRRADPPGRPRPPRQGVRVEDAVDV